MIKFDFNIWNQQNSLEQNNDDLPLFIDINNLIKLASFYNTSIDYLVGITDEIKPYSKSKRES